MDHAFHSQTLYCIFNCQGLIRDQLCMFTHLDDCGWWSFVVAVILKCVPDRIHRSNLAPVTWCLDRAIVICRGSLVADSMDVLGDLLDGKQARTLKSEEKSDLCPVSCSFLICQNHQMLTANLSMSVNPLDNRTLSMCGPVFVVCPRPALWFSMRADSPR